MLCKNVKYITTHFICEIFFCSKETDRWGLTTPGWPLMLGCGFPKAGLPLQARGAQNIRVSVSHTRVPLSCAPRHVLVAEKGNFPMGSTTKSYALQPPHNSQPLITSSQGGRFFFRVGAGTFSNNSSFSVLQTKIYYPA